MGDEVNLPTCHTVGVLLRVVNESLQALTCSE